MLKLEGSLGQVGGQIDTAELQSKKKKDGMCDKAGQEEAS